MNENNVFNNLPTLTTKRLVLRKFNYNDVSSVFEYTSDPEVTKYLSWNFQTSESEALEFLNIVTENYIKGRPAPWAIVLAETDKIIGSIGITEWNPFFNRVEIGFLLKKEMWGKGYSKEAIIGVLNFCFETLNINRVEATCEIENKISSHLLESVGMIYEGTLRDFGMNNGNPVDLKMFSILRKDWRTKD